MTRTSSLSVVLEPTRSISCSWSTRSAWKYTGNREEAEIRVGKNERGGVTSLYVRDNGAGFDPEKAGLLFVPLQRLHSPDEFPGNGIGLATVQRIIFRHGGKIWAEGAVDAGATFSFTIPDPA